MNLLVRNFDTHVQLAGIARSYISLLHTGHEFSYPFKLVLGGPRGLVNNDSSCNCQHSPLRTMVCRRSNRLSCYISISSSSGIIGEINGRFLQRSSS